MQNRKPQGQVLVLVALGILVLVGAVMLAVDVGNLYAERRHMQNAADSGALAGARELCFVSNDQGSARDVAEDYATVKNRAEFADVTFSAVTGTIPISVTVVASETAETFFGGIFGIDTADVSATASATCGPAAAAAGLWPLALRHGTYEALYNETCSGGSGYFYVMLTNEPIRCDYEVGGEDDGVPDDIQVDCDLFDDDNIVDLFAWRSYEEDDPFSGGDRGWIDFSAVVDESGPLQDDCISGGCGAREMMCLMSDGSNVLLEPPFCAPGASGLKSGNFRNANFDAEVVGSFASLPTFRKVGCSACADLDDDGDLDDLPVPANNNCGGGSAEPVNFCITGFACAQVIGEEQGIELCNAADPDDCSPLNNVKLLKFQLQCGEQACQTNLGYTDPGQTGDPFSPKAVTLTK